MSFQAMLSRTAQKWSNPIILPTFQGCSQQGAHAKNDISPKRLLIEQLITIHGYDLSERIVFYMSRIRYEMSEEQNCET